MISKDMPGDRPGTLSTRAAIDIVAYILQTNGHPPGNVELQADRETLERISIEKP
jgi:hypothetical protein